MNRQNNVVKSDYTYLVFAYRDNSEFDQEYQLMRCKVLEAHRDHLVVESLKRYNQKYAGAEMAIRGRYVGMPVRRINKDQCYAIVDETTSVEVPWETVRRREGATTPGRSRGGR
jgi:hypothetical protein